MPLTASPQHAKHTGMTTSEAIAFFRSAANLARALGVTPGAISQWVKTDVLPEGRQYQVEILTGGALKADRNVSVRKGRMSQAA